jgi:hypothetical protein
MKKMFIILTIISAVFCSIQAFALDPSGTWGIEGRTDAKLEVNCSGGVCKCQFQSAYSKAKCTGYVRENKLALSYDEKENGGNSSLVFVVYEMLDKNRMSSKTLDLTGKVLGGSNWFRQ